MSLKDFQLSIKYYVHPVCLFGLIKKDGIAS